MARPATGTVYDKGDHFAIRVTLRDGSRGSPVHLPPVVTHEKAVELAAEMSRLERLPLAPAAPEAPAPMSLEAWAEAWFADRRRRGQTSVRQDEGRWRKWIAPTLAPLTMATVGPEDAARLVQVLDEAVLAKEIRWKTASLTWGVFTSACAVACKSKNLALRVRPRESNPTINVCGPEAGDERVCGWIYPVEAKKLLACQRVPIRWRRLFALSIYLYLRPGELEALEAGAVDLVGGIVTIHKAADRTKAKGATKKVKNALVHRIPIEPAIRPLLEQLVDVARAEGRTLLVSMPPISDLAESFRVYLRRAGIDREELFADDDARRPIRFYDLRATGITWRALRNDGSQAIQDAAGHKSFETTSGYIRSASSVGLLVGTPFPPLPEALLSIGTGFGTGEFQGGQMLESEGNLRASPAGFEPVAQGGVGGTSRRNPRVSTPIGSLPFDEAARIAWSMSKRVRTQAPEDLLARFDKLVGEMRAALVRLDQEAARSAYGALAEFSRYGGPRRRGMPRHVTWAGETLTVSEWARRLGRTSQGLWWRLENMPLSEAMDPQGRAPERKRVATDRSNTVEALLRARAAKSGRAA